MSLRNTLKNLVNQTITSSIGDLNATVIFNSKSTSSYDAVTGQVTVAVTTHSCVGVLTSLEQSEMVNTDLMLTGRKLLVPTLQLPGVDVDALDDDVTVDGSTYAVFKAGVDPSGSLFTFILHAQGTPGVSGD